MISSGAGCPDESCAAAARRCASGDSFLSAQLRLDLRGILAQREGLGLRQAAGDGQILLWLAATGGAIGSRKSSADALRALMQQLEEGVLRIVAGLAPDHGAGGHGRGRCHRADCLPLLSISSCCR